MKCKKCGSENIQIVQKTTSIRDVSLLSKLLNLFLYIFTCGLWWIVIKIKGKTKQKIKSNTIGVCMNCGNKFKI